MASSEGGRERRYSQSGVVLMTGAQLRTVNTPQLLLGADSLLALFTFPAFGADTLSSPEITFASVLSDGSVKGFTDHFVKQRKYYPSQSVSKLNIKGGDF